MSGKLVYTNVLRSVTSKAVKSLDKDTPHHTHNDALQVLYRDRKYINITGEPGYYQKGNKLIKKVTKRVPTLNEDEDFLQEVIRNSLPETAQFSRGTSYTNLTGSSHTPSALQ